MPLLTAKFVKTFIFSLEFTLSFKKNVLKQTQNAFDAKF